MDAKKPGAPAAGDEKAQALGANGASASKGKLKGIGGSQLDDWNCTLLNQTLGTLWLDYSDKEASDRRQRATIAGLHGIGPKDELEGMIAAQLLAAHNAAMECHRRAMFGGQTFEGRRENLNQANKLSRTFVTLLEALDRHRGKGQQKVPVEHLHLHVGGQAVVGAVAPPKGVSPRDLEDQRDAEPIVHAPQPAMWSPHAERQSVPVASDAERPMSTARRKIDRGAKGKQKRA